MRASLHTDTSSAALGAVPGSGATCFRVWAPNAARLELYLLKPPGLLPMEAQESGYFKVTADARPGDRYFFRLDSRDLPDPASRYQPHGVHGPSEIVDPHFEWSDVAWKGLAIEAFVFYELHVGAFTPEGTFDSVIPHLPWLRDLGVTAIELMPVGQFPGDRNWGYDGAFPFAVQNSYGGPDGLRRLVDACHRLDLAVVLDVVYNHIGPEGNYLAQFGPYFTAKYQTPWGPAINFDDRESDEVRRFFIENALHWIRDYHIDALRLDAVHAIHDESAHPFLEQLGQAVHHEGESLGRRVYLFPESDLNDIRLLRPRTSGGMGLDAQWSDDFHHSLHTLLTGERSGYYQDFGALTQLAKAYREGFVYSGQYSQFRRRSHGSPSDAIPARRFIVFTQNHDQVGNRMLGERLSSLLSLDQLKLAAAAVLLSPFLPLIFMGEEYGETAPFLYFVSHNDPALIDAVRAGRKAEFASFAWLGEPPDPQDQATFRRSKLNHSLRDSPVNRDMFDFYRRLLHLRRTIPPLATLSKQSMEVDTLDRERTICIRRWCDHDEVIILLCFSPEPVTLDIPWSGKALLDTPDFSTPLVMPPYAVRIYRKDSEV